MIILRSKEFGWFGFGNKSGRSFEQRQKWEKEHFHWNVDDIPEFVYENMGTESKKIFEFVKTLFKVSKNIWWRERSIIYGGSPELEIDLAPDKEKGANPIEGLLFIYSLKYDSWYLEGYKWVHRFKRIQSFEEFKKILKSHIKKYAPYEEGILGVLK